MKKQLLIAGLVLSTTALVYAHGGAEGVVKERMDLMENLKGAMKTLKPMMRGQESYDVEKVKESALVIRDNAGLHMTKLFTEGSLHKPSEAKPEIWKEWQNFKQISMNLERLGQALHDGAENSHSKSPMSDKGHHGMMGYDGRKKHHMHEEGNHNGHMMSPESSEETGHMMGQGKRGDMGAMMGQGMMHGSQKGAGMPHGLDQMSDEHLASMPSQGLFRMIGQTCGSCHKKYRVEK